MGEWVNLGEDFINSYREFWNIEKVCENVQLFHPFTYFSPKHPKKKKNLVAQIHTA